MIPPDFPKFNEYAVYHDQGQESHKSLLWQPRMVSLHEFAILVEVDEETSNFLCNCKYDYNWLSLFFSVKGTPRPKNKNRSEADYSKPAQVKVHLNGCDDFNYGAWLPEMYYSDFYGTWEKLLTFIREMDFQTQKFSGELLIDFCKHQLGATNIDYN